MAARYYVLKKGETGKSGSPVSLDGYPNQTEAMRAINWQHYGGISDRRNFVVVRPGPERGVFRDLDGFSLISTNGGFTEEAYQQFLERVWS